MDDNEAAEEARRGRAGEGIRRGFPASRRGYRAWRLRRHLHKRLAAVLRLKIHPAAAVGDDVDRVAQRQGIQHGELNAVIGGEAENGQLHDPLTTKPAVQFSFLPVTVVKKAL